MITPRSQASRDAERERHQQRRTLEGAVVCSICQDHLAYTYFPCPTVLALDDADAQAARATLAETSATRAERILRLILGAPGTGHDLEEDYLYVVEAEIKKDNFAPGDFAFIRTVCPPPPFADNDPS